jgi:hypothetical protein
MSNLDRLQTSLDSATHKSNLDRLETLDSAARVIQVRPSTLRRWVRQGRIHGHTLEAASWSSLIDFEAFLNFPACPPSTYFRVSEILTETTQ